MSRKTNLAQQSDDKQQDDGASANHIPLSKRAFQSIQRIWQRRTAAAVSKASATKPAATPTADRVQEDMMEQLEDFNAIADTFVPDQLSIDELRHEVTRIKTERKRDKEKP